MEFPFTAITCKIQNPKNSLCLHDQPTYLYDRMFSLPLSKLSKRPVFLASLSILVVALAFDSNQAAIPNGVAKIQLRIREREVFLSYLNNSDEVKNS